jgi:serine/threonine-protein kinase
VHDIGQDETTGTSFIAMEYVEGQNLKEVLSQGRPLGFEQIGEIIAQVADALDFAHAKGIVHRDVKPANIWMCLDGTVKLLDFGIATAASSTVTVLDNLSSPGYMSPEQIAGGDVDARTDIYSAGVVVYEMLTGQRPFEGDSPTGIMLKVVNEAAKPIADRELPPALTAAVARAMEKEPADRYARAADFGRDLKAIKASVTNQRDTATMVFDREALRKLTAAAPPPRPPAARTPNAKLQPAVSFGAVWLRSPLMIVLVAVVVLAAAIIGWCASRPAL